MSETQLAEHCAGFYTRVIIWLDVPPPPPLTGNFHGYRQCELPPSFSTGSSLPSALISLGSPSLASSVGCQLTCIAARWCGCGASGVVHVVALQVAGLMAARARSSSACFRLRRRVQNVHSAAPPMDMIPTAVAIPMPAAAPVLSPPLPLEPACVSPAAATPVDDDAVSDASAEVAVCKVSEADPEVGCVVVSAAVVAVAVSLFRMTIPYAMMVPGAKMLMGVPAVSPPLGVPSIVVKAVSVSTRYTLMQPSVGPHG